MLKLKYLFENFDQAKEALANWPHDVDTLDEMLKWFRISSNMIYPYRRNGEVCFLRLAPTDEKREQNVRAELAFIEYLRANGYPAMKSIAAGNGETLLVLKTKGGDVLASAFECVPGDQIEDQKLTDELLFSYGKALGQMHALSERFEPNIRRWTHAEVLNWIGDVLREYKAPPRAFSELERLREALAALPKTKATYGLVHYDFEPDNVFYDADTKTCAVIDFDDAMYHWYALDVEQAFGELQDMLDGEALENAEAVFLDGYRSARPYTGEMDATRPLMRRFVNLYGYARLIRSVDETFPDEPEWLIELREKLNGVIAAKEAGFGD